jgi:hypothetical protein
MVSYVVRDKDFNEWYDLNGTAKGSWRYHVKTKFKYFFIVIKN